MTIYVVSHLPLTDRLLNGYEYLYVGKAAEQFVNSYPERTDRKYHENIGYKNANYCELTGLHRIAMDATSDPDGIYGLVHYRRRFLRQNSLLWRVLARMPAHWISPAYFANSFSLNELTYDHAEAILNDKDLIVPCAWLMRYSVRDQYAKYHDAAGLELIRQTLSEFSPHYLPAYERVLSSWYLRPFNMMVARGHILHDYTQWLFSVLSIFESKIDISILNPYQQRIFGFVAERLANVYLEHHRELRICSLPVAFVAHG